MVQSPIELSEIITVKICHDLAGPIGAMNNGVELLKDKDSGSHIQEESINLIEISAQESVHKLMYFRQCYGTASFDGEHNIEALRDITLNYFRRTKITIDWQLPKPAFGTTTVPTIPTTATKIVLNAILVAAGCLVFGGTIKIRIARDFHKVPISVRGEGRLVKVTPEVLAPLVEESEAKASIKNLQAYLIAKFLKGSETQFSFTHGDDFVEFNFT
jgi:histidine phosphotransferase ChpT